MEETGYKSRRERLLDQIEDGIAIIGSGKYKKRSNDTDFPFRQNSNFKYLTGLNEPDSVLVLSNIEGIKRTIIFTRPNDPVAEMWAGKRPGLEKTMEMLEADQAFDIADFEKEMANLLPGHKNLYIHFRERADLFRKVTAISGDLFHKKRSTEKLPPSTIKNVGTLVESMRLIKDQNEILTMKKAMVSTNLAHRAAMAMAKPGLSEKDITALIEYFFARAESHGNAYDNIVAGGNNANILHYIKNDEELKDGDLLLIDAGSHINHYATDITRTFPVNGKFRAAQKDVYEIVLEAQKSAISHCWPERTLGQLHESCSKVLTQGLIDLKVLTGSVEENLEKKTFRKYFPHGTGHWLGLDVHDQNPYLNDDNTPVGFEPGVIFTIEPGLYFPKEDASLPEHLKGIGIRIEDNILITKQGHENLSSMIPKEVKEVEEACAQDYKDLLI
jgi:Xaa-Pro aminopeptidase